jgi:VCBS repeat-containing protein
LKTPLRLVILAVLVTAALSVMTATALASTLKLDEEFNSTSLDTNVWTHTDPWWQYHGHDDLEFFDPSECTISGGYCDLRCEKRAANGYAYQSGIISSLNHQKFLYGYFEVRAKIPGGPGIWPAFWMVGDHSEIDGLEMPGDVPNRVYMTYHEGDAQVYQGYKDGIWTAGFHTYGIDWQPTYIKWYIDGDKVAEYDHATPIDPQTICFNTIVGGTWSGSPTAATRFPNDFLIDYVRVYDTKPLPNSVPVAVADSYAASSGETLRVVPGVLANDSDADDSTLTASVTTRPSHGTVTMATDGSFDYAPDAGYWGTDSFTYDAWDGGAYSNTATVYLTVSAVGVSAPITSPDAYVCRSNSVLTVGRRGVLDNDTDPNGAAMVASILSKPIHGALVLAADGTFSYVPNTDYHGPDCFTYVVSDGKTISHATLVQLAVARPVAVSTPSVKRLTRTSCKITGHVMCDAATTADGAVLTLKVVVQRLVGGKWHKYTQVTISNPPSSYFARLNVHLGRYRLRTSVGSCDVPEGISAWAGFRVR